MAIYDDNQTAHLLEAFPEFSAAEVRIVTMYSSGMSTKAIGHILKKSNKTINNHLSNAQQKLEVDSFSELRSVFNIRILLLVLTLVKK
ncbi:transcriptional regulator FimZ [Yersinia aldovae]|uniref:helix-turn-helix transcriptional regulator n=1 Tax=Yersinia aldovae TaxID=29483 RepID=UPI0005DE8452|nr:helix-turn-helix domain-containing protein [Yersinia aldovae]CNK25912.1 transcriptional regulator FimZ [Yersinia aldovae]